MTNRQIKDIVPKAWAAARKNTALRTARLATVSLLEQYRGGAHANLSRFFGDVFVYLNERDHNGEPGPIVATVMGAILDAVAAHPKEPRIVITHSMGGNILYDILTHYDRSRAITIDFWASIGGQVAQFEEMSLFKASNRKIVPPAKVMGLEGRVGYWLNVYDPVDPFGFMAAPVFGDVDADEAYMTGEGLLKPHGAYFKRPSFYGLLSPLGESAE